jgi:hypothetical protein
LRRSLPSRLLKKRELFSAAANRFQTDQTKYQVVNVRENMLQTADLGGKGSTPQETNFKALPNGSGGTGGVWLSPPPTANSNVIESTKASTMNRMSTR